MRRLKQNGFKPDSHKEYFTDELFLCFADEFSLKADTIVHRKAIFNYIQTNITPKSESNLQGALNSSKYWAPVGDAMYKFKKIGRQKLELEYDPELEESLVFQEVEFSVRLQNHIVSVLSFPDNRRYKLFIDKNERKSDEICCLIEKLDQGYKINQIGTSVPREILAWVFRQNYTWVNLNYEKL